MTALYGPALLDGSSVGPFELLIITMVVLILFGPDRLPQVARTLGRMMANFRRASDDLKGQIMRMDHDLEREDTPSIGGGKQIVVKQGEHSEPRLPLSAIKEAPALETPVAAPAPAADTDVKPDSGVSA